MEGEEFIAERFIGQSEIDPGAATMTVGGELVPSPSCYPLATVSAPIRRTIRGRIKALGVRL